MKIAVVGGVSSTRVLVEKLFEHGFLDVQVWGYSPDNHEMVSGWSNLEEPSLRFGYAFTPFVRVADCKQDLAKFGPDLIFVVGLSQIIPADIIAIPRISCIGFHPTALPQGRGRAAIAWLILEQVGGAASFFIIREGVDDGPIVAQQPFLIDAHDDAASVERKILAAEEKALDDWLPDIANIQAVEQDHSAASWYGRRTPEDGWLDWTKSNADLLRLIRASTRPHPGAYTFHQGNVITIWAAETIDTPHKGVTGRILEILPDGGYVVQCGEGLIKINSWSAAGDPAWRPRVGQKLGYYAEAEIHRLLEKNRLLENRISALEAMMSAQADGNTSLV